MSVQEIIDQIKALPLGERAQVTKFIVETDDSWVPDSFKEAMKAAGEGRFGELETALSIRSIKGHRVLTPVFSQGELAEEMFGRQ